MEDFSIQKKIYYHDTDCGGVVYYANYLKHLEEARSEFCASRGINLKELSDAGTYFVVAHAEIDYKAPARYHDTLTVSARVEKVGSSSIFFFQKVTRDGAPIIESRTTWVCIGSDFKPKPIPPEIKKRFLP